MDEDKQKENLTESLENLLGTWNIDENDFLPGYEFTCTITLSSTGELHLYRVENARLGKKKCIELDDPLEEEDWKIIELLFWKQLEHRKIIETLRKFNNEVSGDVVEAEKIRRWFSSLDRMNMIFRNRHLPYRVRYKKKTRSTSSGFARIYKVFIPE